VAGLHLDLLERLTSRIAQPMNAAHRDVDRFVLVQDGLPCRRARFRRCPSRPPGARIAVSGLMRQMGCSTRMTSGAPMAPADRLPMTGQS
jgi:hypothetical protein